MKKFAKNALLIFCCTVLLLTGCSKKAEEKPETNDNALEITETDNTSEFYKTITEGNERPIAVMIDNDNSSAWPQSGLDKAYKVYEIIVEGGATRFMALFKNTDCEKIGPVRSSRHYFLDYVLENDAIYVHYGWSPKAANDISALGINKINGVLGGDGNIFWRERKYSGDWHSAYTNIEKIKDMANNKNYRNTTDKKITGINKEFEEISGSDAKNITLPYSGMYKVYYTYDASIKAYKRKMNSTEHKSADGTYYTATNIIIQYANNFPLGDGSPRQDVTTVGSGEGYFITGGKCIPITWQKSSRSSETVYKTQDGKDIELNPGTTWINIISPATKAIME
ncbi:MAG: DUF3048 domain-containing protein [Clostridia bacterium]|nr:DUF3048 domain-containing protein [Clostridia bacterium]